MFHFCGPNHDYGYQSDFLYWEFHNSRLGDVDTSNEGFSFSLFLE